MTEPRNEEERVWMEQISQASVCVKSHTFVKVHQPIGFDQICCSECGIKLSHGDALEYTCHEYKMRKALR
jgi:hypothetical protein